MYVMPRTPGHRIRLDFNMVNAYWDTKKNHQSSLVQHRHGLDVKRVFRTLSLFFGTVSVQCN